MPPSSNLFRAARPAFRANQFFRPNQAGRGARFQSTTAEAPNSGSWAKRMWDSPVGVKTVHFWAPVMKWALVIAGISDLARPAEKLSLTQNAALTSTGIIWTRWCLIIKPKNYLLAAVNFFLGMVGVVQCSRIFLHRQSQKTLTEQVETKVEEAKQAVNP
ncbi:hypothetical protein B0J18DRAFT_362908 [Chaetomium sp. MPI-SDFR-AT-0129]|nr:hypothetical protein B0J18DRAFT_362908 [Chaetomium sp. MPI-SDFR-AT-0129]